MVGSVLAKPELDVVVLYWEVGSREPDEPYTSPVVVDDDPVYPDEPVVPMEPVVAPPVVR